MNSESPPTIIEIPNAVYKTSIGGLFAPASNSLLHSIRLGRVTIGKSQYNTIAIEDETLSKIHCEIRTARLDNGAFQIYISDLGSTNGTSFIPPGKTQPTICPPFILVGLPSDSIVMIGGLSFVFRMCEHPSDDHDASQCSYHRQQQGTTPVLSPLQQRRQMDEALTLWKLDGELPPASPFHPAVHAISRQASSSADDIFDGLNTLFADSIHPQSSATGSDGRHPSSSPTTSTADHHSHSNTRGKEADQRVRFNLSRTSGDGARSPSPHTRAAAKAGYANGGGSTFAPPTLIIPESEHAYRADDVDLDLEEDDPRLFSDDLEFINQETMQRKHEEAYKRHSSRWSGTSSGSASHPHPQHDASNATAPPTLELPVYDSADMNDNEPQRRSDSSRNDHPTTHASESAHRTESYGMSSGYSYDKDHDDAVAIDNNVELPLEAPGPLQRCADTPSNTALLDNNNNNNNNNNNHSTATLGHGLLSRGGHTSGATGGDFPIEPDFDSIGLALDSGDDDLHDTSWLPVATASTDSVTLQPVKAKPKGGKRLTTMNVGTLDSSFAFGPHDDDHDESDDNDDDAATAQQHGRNAEGEADTTQIPRRQSTVRLEAQQSLAKTEGNATLSSSTPGGQDAVSHSRTVSESTSKVGDSEHPSPVPTASTELLPGSASNHQLAPDVGKDALTDTGDRDDDAMGDSDHDSPTSAALEEGGSSGDTTPVHPAKRSRLHLTGNKDHQDQVVQLSDTTLQDTASTDKPPEEEEEEDDDDVSQSSSNHADNSSDPVDTAEPSSTSSLDSSGCEDSPGTPDEATAVNKHLDTDTPSSASDCHTSETSEMSMGLPPSAVASSLASDNRVLTKASLAKMEKYQVRVLLFTNCGAEAKTQEEFDASHGALHPCVILPNLHDKRLMQIHPTTEGEEEHASYPVVVAPLLPTHLITPSLARSAKLLGAISSIRYVVSPEWFTNSLKRGSWLQESRYSILDVEKLHKSRFYTSPSPLTYMFWDSLQREMVLQNSYATLVGIQPADYGPGCFNKCCFVTLDETLPPNADLRRIIESASGIHLVLPIADAKSILTATVTTLQDLAVKILDVTVEKAPLSQDSDDFFPTTTTTTSAPRGRRAGKAKMCPQPTALHLTPDRGVYYQNYPLLPLNTMTVCGLLHRASLLAEKSAKAKRPKAKKPSDTPSYIFDEENITTLPPGYDTFRFYSNQCPQEFFKSAPPIQGYIDYIKRQIHGGAIQVYLVTPDDLQTACKPLAKWVSSTQCPTYKTELIVRSVLDMALCEDLTEVQHE